MDVSITGAVIVITPTSGAAKSAISARRIITTSVESKTQSSPWARGIDTLISRQAEQVGGVMVSPLAAHGGGLQLIDAALVEGAGTADANGVYYRDDDVVFTYPTDEWTIVPGSPIYVLDGPPQRIIFYVSVNATPAQRLWVIFCPILQGTLYTHVGLSAVPWGITYLSALGTSPAPTVTQATIGDLYSSAGASSQPIDAALIAGTDIPGLDGVQPRNTSLGTYYWGSADYYVAYDNFSGIDQWYFHTPDADYESFLEVPSGADVDGPWDLPELQGGPVSGTQTVTQATGDDLFVAPDLTQWFVRVNTRDMQRPLLIPVGPDTTVTGIGVTENSRAGAEAVQAIIAAAITA